MSKQTGQDHAASYRQSCPSREPGHAPVAQPDGRNRALSATPGRLTFGLALVALCLFAHAAFAGAVNSGAYTVRYSVINSLQIPPTVARDNGIERDGHNAIVTITLQRPTDDKPLQAVPAAVSGQARTLMGAPQALDFRRVESAGSVYSIAVLPLAADEQTVTLELEVSTTDGSTLIPVTFTKKLYIRAP